MGEKNSNGVTRPYVSLKMKLKFKKNYFLSGENTLTIVKSFINLILAIREGKRTPYQMQKKFQETN